MRLLVTGGAGFIGSHVAEAALAAYWWGLARATRGCHAAGAAGDLALVFVAGAWMLWPMCVPWHLGSVRFYAPCTVVAAMSMYRGRRVIKANWCGSGDGR